MNHTRTAARRFDRSLLPVAVAGLIALSACGSSKTASPPATTTAATTGTCTTTSTTSPATTSPPASTTTAQTSTAEVTIDTTQQGDVVAYRPNEIIAESGLSTNIHDALKLTTDIHELSLTVTESPGAVNLSIYELTINDMHKAIADLAAASSPVSAAPNYLSAFSPVWRYSPYGDPTCPTTPQNQSMPLSGSTQKIVVLDTGFMASPLATSPAPTFYASSVPTSSTPMPIPNSTATLIDVTAGNAAGHGTFIANLLFRLLPDANYSVVRISPTKPSDDNFKLTNGQTTSVRDDAAIIAAVQLAVSLNAVYINMSFGTVLGPQTPDNATWPPSKLKDVFQKLKDGGTKSQVFAAAGNDSIQVGDTVDKVYPAAWAKDFGFLHSVGSNPKNEPDPNKPGSTIPVDYSNHGDWVTAQAMGTNAVSLLPDVAGSASGWYKWSGTSFAAPCALAEMVAGKYFDIASKPNDFMNCGDTDAN